MWVEAGGGRICRQPGQVRKEAALTILDSGRSPVSFSIFAAHGRYLTPLKRTGAHRDGAPRRRAFGPQRFFSSIFQVCLLR